MCPNITATLRADGHALVTLSLKGMPVRPGPFRILEAPDDGGAGVRGCASAAGNSALGTDEANR